MHRNFVFLTVFVCLFTCLAGAQTKPPSGPYQVPTVIYIGDRGRLYFPLNAFAEIPKGAELFPQSFPQENDIVINSIFFNEWENTLVIDFQAYRTGIVQLPVLDLGGIELKGLEVRIASLLDSGQNPMILSAQAEPLSAPGTFWLITLFVLCVIVFLLLVYFFCTSGRVFFYDLNTKARTFFLVFSMKRTIESVQKSLSKEKINGLQAVSTLSGELRRFLSVFLRFNFISMASEEFLSVTAPFAVLNENETKMFLYEFFKHCDLLRFSGEGIDNDAVQGIIEDAKRFVDSLKTKKNVTKT